MLCPTCETLQRDHSRECELEAKAILRQHKPFSEDSEADVMRPGNLVDVIIESRKRQLELTSEINEHRASAHAANAVGSTNDAMPTRHLS